MDSQQLLIIYCLLIIAASLTGGFIPVLFKLTHRQIQFSLSFVAGILLAVALLQLLPHAMIHVEQGSLGVYYALIFGLLVMFLLERFFCFHHHEISTDGTQCSHHHNHSEHDLTWTGVVIGLSVHSLFCGMALAASVAIGETAGSLEFLAGFGVFLGIVSHKPFDALTISTLLDKSGYNNKWKVIVNLLFACVIPFGVLTFFFSMNLFENNELYLAYILSFSAGMFLFISLSDLIPELQSHDHDKGLLTFFFILGIVFIALSSELEHSSHNHNNLENFEMQVE